MQAVEITQKVNINDIYTRAHTQQTEYEKAYKEFLISKNNMDYRSSFRADYERRGDMVRKYAWAIPTGDLLWQIKDHGPFVEVGAGTGYWAYEMQKRGIDVIPTDAFPTDRTKNPYDMTKAWTHVMKCTATHAAKFYSNRTLLTVWPSYDQDWTSDMLKAYTRWGGKKIVYVGEGQWGCTGNKLFHRILNKFWNCVENYDIPQWDGIHDYVTVWVRK